MRYDSEGDQEFQLDKLFNKGLTVQDNFNWGIVEFVAVSGVNTIQHGLGFIPNGYILLASEVELTLSDPDITQWTTEK